jgi:hypothetical protein
MTTPLPAEIILPTGQPAYLNPYRGTYTTSRAYARRMQSNYSRGLSQTTARGHQPPEGLTEYALRAQRFQQQYGITYSWWRKLNRKWIREINAMSSPSAQITPVIIATDQDAVRGYGIGPVPGIVIPPENYTEERLAEKLYDMQQYREGNTVPGRQSFYTRENIRPIELWWYH